MELASFSPAPANNPRSSSDMPRKMRNKRVKTQGSAVTEISIALAILVGDRNRYAMFLWAENACRLLLEQGCFEPGKNRYQENILDKVSSCMQRHSELVQHVHKVRDKITERHRETIPGCDKFVGINCYFGTSEEKTSTYGTHGLDDHLHRFIVQGSYDHFTFKVLKRTAWMYSQEVFIFLFSKILGWWPCQR